MTREEAIERFENIKANALVQKASGVSEYWQNEIDGTIEAIDMAIEALQREDRFLKSMETNEPLYTEVVRCKDCRWWNEDAFPRAFPEKKTSACEVPNIYGANFSRYTQEDEFCSRGERKGGEDK